MRAEASMESFFERSYRANGCSLPLTYQELKSGFASAGVAAGATNRKQESEQ